MAIDKILDLIFPKYCLGCKKEGEFLCSNCKEKLLFHATKICPVCKREVFGKCCPGSHLDDLWTLSNYSDWLAAEAIQKIKYEFVIGLINNVWQTPLEMFWHQQKDNINVRSVLIPIPLHHKRFLERGFNQSELITKQLSAISGLRLETELISRIKYNKPQVGLSGLDRKANVRGIFKVNYLFLSESWGQEIILVDDVYTTGSTMAEVARALKSAGFKRVSGLVLAVD